MKLLLKRLLFNSTSFISALLILAGIGVSGGFTITESVSADAPAIPGGGSGGIGWVGDGWWNPGDSFGFGDGGFGGLGSGGLGDGSLGDGSCGTGDGFGSGGDACGV